MQKLLQQIVRVFVRQFEVWEKSDSIDYLAVAHPCRAQPAPVGARQIALNRNKQDCAQQCDRQQEHERDARRKRRNQPLQSQCGVILHGGKDHAKAVELTRIPTVGVTNEANGEKRPGKEQV